LELRTFLAQIEILQLIKNFFCAHLVPNLCPHLFIFE
jgi:hypothetical protein